MPGRSQLVLAVTAVAVTAACSSQSSDPVTRVPAEQRTSATTVPSSTPTSTPSTVPTTEPTTEPERHEPRRSFVSIPELGMREFPVVRYPGSPDDAPGTALQNAGEMASPRGPTGGVGPGEVGNFIVTGHRLTGAAPLRYSPSLRRGDRIRVLSGDTVFVYEVRRTRWTSFRQPQSLAAQRAPVPGRPGRTATRAMITLSTCATLEDHAVGNYWSDEFDNPEHRIDKIGVLVATRPA